ncbi:MAG: hypothetical protein SNG35_07275 [Rikenellaceae bacterium]
MKKIIYWTLPIWAFVVQYLVMGLLFMIHSLFMLESIEGINLFNGYTATLIIPLIIGAVAPFLFLLPIGGIIIGYIYIIAIRRAKSKRAVDRATLVFFLIALPFVPVTIVIPYLYIIPLAFAARKCRKWVSNIELSKE